MLECHVLVSTKAFRRFLHSGQLLLILPPLFLSSPSSTCSSSPSSSSSHPPHSAPLLFFALHLPLISLYGASISTQAPLPFFLLPSSPSSVPSPLHHKFGLTSSSSFLCTGGGGGAALAHLSQRIFHSASVICEFSGPCRNCITPVPDRQAREGRILTENHLELDACSIQP